MSPRNLFSCGFLVLMASTACFFATRAQGKATQNEAAPQVDSAQYAKQLSSLDPLTRRAAAEALARLAAVDQRKLVEGYVLEEKDKRVRLALHWALYRMGRSAALFQVVRDLDSSRHEQAADYLAQLESPEPLYLFLRQDNTTIKVKGRLIEVLGQIGDNNTLAEIKPFADSFDPKVAAAAQSSMKQIEERLSQSQPPGKSRPRVVGKGEQPFD
jgi:HEAT repeat protein